MEMAGIGEARFLSDLTQCSIGAQEVLCCEREPRSQSEGPEADAHCASEEVVEARGTQAARGRCL
jgi:hypothetical protein